MAVGKFKIYLSFRNKSTAEKWLKSHGVDINFSKSNMIYIDVDFKGKDCEKRNSQETV